MLVFKKNPEIANSIIANSIIALIVTQRSKQGYNIFIYYRSIYICDDD